MKGLKITAHTKRPERLRWELVLVTFPVAVIKYPDRSSLKQERLSMVHYSRVQSIKSGMLWQQELEMAVTVCSHEAEVNECLHSVHFLFLIQCRLLGLGIPPIFNTGFLKSRRIKDLN